MRRLLLILCLLAVPALAAPNEGEFAVKVLRAKGLIQGYPNGEYEGKRAMSRYEVVELMDRLERYLDNDMKNFVPRQDLQSLKTSSEGLQKELQQLDGRTGAMEESVERQDQRVDHQKIVRRIVHVDMDAFYASVEQRDHPHWRGLPLVVGGDGRRGVVAAASYEARRFGVFSAMPMGQALKLCPQVIRAAPRFSVYKQVSAQIREIFESYTDRLEPLSLDESYLDLTDYCEEHGKKAGTVAIEIKRAIRETTHLTASAGVGPNKLVAKIASGFKKPDGLTIVPPDQVTAFLHPLPIGALYGVGPVTEKRFLDLGIHTVGQLAEADPHLLQLQLGRSALGFHELAWGRDERPVEWLQEPKSISSEQTFENDVTDLSVLLELLEEQSQQVAGRLLRSGLEAATVQIKLRYADFTTITRSHTGGRPIQDAHEIMDTARTLLLRQSPLPPVRLLGVGVASLLSLSRPRQLELDFG